MKLLIVSNELIKDYFPISKIIKIVFVFVFISTNVKRDATWRDATEIFTKKNYFVTSFFY